MVIHRFNLRIKILLLLTVVGSLLLACDGRGDFKDPESLKALAEMSFGEDGANAQEIAKLKREILGVRRDIVALVSAQGRLMSFYNALGEEYRKNGMFLPALQMFQRSLEIKAVNPGVLYRAGLMSGQLSKFALDAEASQRYLEQAIIYYQNAIEYGNDHGDSLYALAVIKLFEKNDPETARSLAVRLLAKNANDARAMFLLARIALLNGQIDSAINWYEKIIELNTSEADKIQANANLEELRRR
jgi:tetratricopeptide (TPR) repeat protein